MKQYEKIKLLKGEITKLNKELNELLKECLHERTGPKFVETLAFDNTPRRVCLDCHQSVGVLTEEEIKELYKEELESLMDREPSVEEINKFFNKHPRGFNY